MVKEDSCTYTVYALECKPKGKLPTFRDPRVLLFGRFYPIQETPPEIIQNPYYYSEVIDASSATKDEGIPAWKFLAHSAERVYYVGQTSDFENRVFNHREGKGSKLTAEASVKRVVERNEYTQNLRPLVLRALDREIAQLEGSLLLFKPETFHYDSVSKRLTQIQELQAFIESLDGLTLSKTRSIEEKYQIDSLNSLITEMQEERDNKERQLAERLIDAPLYQTQNNGSLDDRLNLHDINTFVYWN